jgi:two-component system chemotaxis response regulator CheB
MKYMPVPVLMVSSLTQKGASVTLDALEAGAIDYVAKPHQNIYDGIDDIEKELIAKVKMVASSNLKARISKRVLSGESVIEKKYSLANTTNKIIAIGASTGGTVALTELVQSLPRDIPGTVIVQHMPAGFTDSFAKRLNEISEVEVAEAKDGDIISKGKVLIAPGDYHMVIRREGGQYKVKLGTGDKVSGHRPSVDVLFNSVSKYAGSNAIGIILTGMGSDGAKGLLQMRNNGAHTIGQDEKSCIVYGMPKVAYDIGAVEMQLSLEKINEKIIVLLNQMER